MEQEGADQQQVGGGEERSGAEERTTMSYCGVDVDGGETGTKQVSMMLTNGNCNDTNSSDNTPVRQSVKCERLDDQDDSQATEQPSGKREESAVEEVSQVREKDNNCDQQRTTTPLKSTAEQQHHGTKQSLIAR